MPRPTVGFGWGLRFMPGVRPRSTAGGRPQTTCALDAIPSRCMPAYEGRRQTKCRPISYSHPLRVILRFTYGCVAGRAGCRSGKLKSHASWSAMAGDKICMKTALERHENRKWFTYF